MVPVKAFPLKIPIGIAKGKINNFYCNKKLYVKICNKY